MYEVKCSIIVPTYNEEKTIQKIIDSLLPLASTGYYEIIVVDDGSTDRTYELAIKFDIQVLRHSYNKGYGASLKTGTRRAEGEYVLFFDADGQHKVEDIQRLMDHVPQFDMVVGERTKESYSPFFRRISKKILHALANYLVATQISDLNSGFRVVKKEIFDQNTHILPNGFSLSTTITLALFKAGYDVKYVPINTEKRAGGKSTVSFFKDGLQALLLINRITMLFNPLKVFVPISLFLFLVGSIFTAYGIVFVKVGVPNLGVLIILSSVIIFFFGVLADQIAVFRRERP